jgi:DNA-binding transcriptional regulator WhiA
MYLKKSDQIADFLILMGATASSLEFENIRIDREFANSVTAYKISTRPIIRKP